MQICCDQIGQRSTTPLTWVDANISLLCFNVPHLFTLNLQKPGTFETSPHLLSRCWKLNWKFAGCWGNIRVQAEAVLLHMPHFLRKTNCVGKAALGNCCCCLTAGQKELRNRAGWGRERSELMGVCESRTFSFCFGLTVLQSCWELLGRWQPCVSRHGNDSGVEVTL